MQMLRSGSDSSGAEVRSGSGGFRCTYPGPDPEGSGAEVIR